MWAAICALIIFQAAIIQRVAQYKLIVHCGACMLTRGEMLLRIHQAKEAGVPVTNYGIHDFFSTRCSQKGLVAIFRRHWKLLKETGVKYASNPERINIVG